MSNSDTDVVIYVTYAGTPETRFDRTYYNERHLPLAAAAWKPHGLKSIAAFYPAVTVEGTIAICECRFRDEAALTAALTAAETAGVMADVKHFTDVEAVMVRAVPK